MSEKLLNRKFEVFHGGRIKKMTLRQIEKKKIKHDYRKIKLGGYTIVGGIPEQPISTLLGQTSSEGIEQIKIIPTIDMPQKIKDVENVLTVATQVVQSADINTDIVLKNKVNKTIFDYLSDKNVMFAVTISLNVLSGLIKLEKLVGAEKILADIFGDTEASKVMIKVFTTLISYADSPVFQQIIKIHNELKIIDGNIIDEILKIPFDGNNFNEIEANAKNILKNLKIIDEDKKNKGVNRSTLYGLMICNIRDTIKELFIVLSDMVVSLVPSNPKTKEVFGSKFIIDKYFEDYSEKGGKEIYNGITKLFKNLPKEIKGLLIDTPTNPNQFRALANQILDFFEHILFGMLAKDYLIKRKKGGGEEKKPEPNKFM